jgi:hypothetical protein
VCGFVFRIDKGEEGWGKMIQDFFVSGLFESVLVDIW